MPRSHSGDIDTLIQLLARLPGLGPRSARRAVLHLISKRTQVMEPLLRSLEHVAMSVESCERCGNIDTSNPCHVCSDTRRDQQTLCVVEDVADLWALDRSESYRGLYHVLGGTLSALDGVGPDELNTASLMSRVQDGGVREVILALSATVDGQTTTHYLAEMLDGMGAKVTALALGLPVGGELDYMDDGTLATALRARSDVL